MRTLVAPFIAPESLPDMDDLLRTIALGVPDIYTVGQEEVVARVDRKQIAGFGERVEDKCVVAAEGSGMLYAWCADKYGVCGRWQSGGVG